MAPAREYRIPPRIGLAGWTDALPQYGLPPGLGNHQPIIVIGCQDFAFHVQTHDGRKWWVSFAAQIDCGSLHDLNGDGRWWHESDPVVLDHWERELRALSTKEGDGHAPARLSRLVWTLERNGRRPLRALLTGKRCYLLTATLVIA